MMPIMKNLSSNQIREIFLNYFESEGHLRIQGSSLLPENDPTLLFINSGMAPLKPYFTGAKKPPSPDLCNLQPCIRTRDIDDVGDRHHLTFFEMLGSWSIGHYFKERAVELAYGLLVNRFSFPIDKIYVTVYSGDPALGLEPDHETAKAWERVGIPREQIVYLGEDNFWGPAGETGPCGPCTEMFFDTGDAFGPRYEPGGYFDSKKRYIEVWNAGVFMQFDKKADGTFDRLPFQSVDTGSGLERLALVLQGVQSVYETDLFKDLMAAVKQQAAGKLSEEGCRIISDHVRASCFILSEGILPGNEGRAYIPRRLIRKCVTVVAHAGIDDFDYSMLVDVVVNRFGSHYPMLVQHRETVTNALLRETREFGKVIGRGLDRLEQLCDRPTPFTISGKDAFDLFATFGLPIEITREFLNERGGSIDEEGYAAEYRRHQEVSRAIAEAETKEWVSDARTVERLLQGRVSDFVGYEMMDCDATVLALVQLGHSVDEATEGSRVEVLTTRTPFYAESGGQVGDHGEICGQGGAVLRVLDTQKIADTNLHRAEVVKGTLRRGESVRMQVDENIRRATMANHSATHLMHAALREILGTHVRQAGSLVDAERLRFDFDHMQKTTPEQLQTIEQRVNQLVRENHVRETITTTYAKAVDAGALAFFGESYGENVRMVRFGTASAELCGGTHVTATGEIGLFRIVSESSIASGVRRIVALTAAAAVHYTQEQDQLIRQIAGQLKVPAPDLPAKVAQLINKGIGAKHGTAAPQLRIDTKSKARTLPGGLRFIAERMDASAEVLSEEALRVAAEIGGVVLLAGEAEGKAVLVVAVSKDKAARYNANSLLKLLLPYIDGKGGGSAHLARGGGANAAGIAALLTNASQHLE